MSETTAETGATATTWHGQEGDPIVVLAHDWNGRLPWIVVDRFNDAMDAQRYLLQLFDRVIVERLRFGNGRRLGQVIGRFGALRLGHDVKMSVGTRDANG